MFSLLKLGAMDFITLLLKNMEIFPRLWRLLEHQREQNTLTYRLGSCRQDVIEMSLKP